MNGKKLFKEIGNINEEILESALKQKSLKQIVNLYWKMAAAAVACIAVILSAVLFLPKLNLGVLTENSSSGQDEASLNSNTSKSDDYVSEAQNSDDSSADFASDVQSDEPVQSTADVSSHIQSEQERYTSTSSVTSSEPEEEMEVYFPKDVNDIPSDWICFGEGKTKYGYISVTYRDRYDNEFIFNKDSGKLILFYHSDNFKINREPIKYDPNKAVQYKKYAIDFLKRYIPFENYTLFVEGEYSQSYYVYINGFKSVDTAVISLDNNGEVTYYDAPCAGMFDGYNIPEFDTADIIKKVKEQHGVEVAEANVSSIYVAIDRGRYKDKLSVMVETNIFENERAKRYEVLYDLE